MRLGEFSVDFVNLRTESYSDGTELQEEAAAATSDEEEEDCEADDAYDGSALADCGAARRDTDRGGGGGASSDQRFFGSRIPASMAIGTPREDALRRDLTINSLFYNLRTGEVEDLTGRGYFESQLDQHGSFFFSRLLAPPRFVSPSAADDTRRGALRDPTSWRDRHTSPPASPDAHNSHDDGIRDGRRPTRGSTTSPPA